MISSSYVCPKDVAVVPNEINQVEIKIKIKIKITITPTKIEVDTNSSTGTRTRTDAACPPSSISAAATAMGHPG